MHKGSIYTHNIFRITVGLILVILLSAPVTSALAADGGNIILTPPVTTRFPEISFFIEPFKADGSFIDDLLPSQIQVQEDGKALPAAKLDKIQPGIQLTVALNTAAYMATQEDGKATFKKIMDSLVSYAQAQPQDTPDTFNLATNAGVKLSGSKDPQEWVKALQDFQPDPTINQASLKSLTDALDLTTSPAAQANVKRAILYITPLPTAANLLALPNLVQRASQQGVTVFVWVLAPENNGSPAAMVPLQDMADHTGGKVVYFTDDSAKAQVEDLLKPMRYVYSLAYTSGLSQGGSHKLSVHILRSDFEGVSPEQDFSLDIEPPNPMFLAPPELIQRKLIKDATQKISSLEPVKSDIQIIIEFPDNHPRPLAQTRLYVDGVVVAKNTAEPFDRFDWPLDAYVATGKHLLKVEAIDSLGMSRTSIESPVEVDVEKPASIFSRLGEIPWQKVGIWGAALAAALAVAGVLVFVGRKRKAILESATPVRPPASASVKSKPRNKFNDPVTQPVPISQDAAPRKASDRISTNWPRAAANTVVPARLVGIAEAGSPVPRATILLTRPEITLGSDPKQSIQVLDNPSVDGLHARIFQSPEGDFFIADAGSVAGTWVNYAPVAREGVRLEHGDLIHLGRVSFRFELTNPRRIRQPVVTPLDEKE
jgi:pSer/pThr/pTyr-binding forkhead associated (FHA) protein